MKKLDPSPMAAVERLGSFGDSARRETPQGTGPWLLLVDDDPFQHQVLAKMLEGETYRMCFASSGLEAVTRFQEVRPALVMLDVHMPGIDGFETCRRIRELPEGGATPILFLSSDSDRDGQDHALLSGGDDFLNKPIGATELLLRVRSLVRIKGLHQDLGRERDALAAMQERKDQLLRFLVHDLKNPLQGILSGVEMAMFRADLPPKSQEDLQRVRRSTETLFRMVLDLLEVEGAQPLAPLLDQLDARTLLETVALDMEARTSLHNQSLGITSPWGLAFRGDSELLRRALLNLLDNALKYGARDLPVELEAEDHGTVISLKVRDRGPGIPEAHLARVFDPFFRLERDADQARVSSGLGLAFCRLVAEAHGGGIRVENHPEGGACFVLEVPKQGPAASTPTPANAGL